MTRSRTLTSCWIVLLALRLSAEDATLVTAEVEPVDLVSGLESIEAGRVREGVELLAKVISRGGSAGAAVRLIRVPNEGLPPAAAAIRVALEGLSSPPEGNPPVQGAAGDPATPAPRGLQPGPVGIQPRFRPLGPTLRRGLPVAGRRFLPEGDVAELCLAGLPPEALQVYLELYGPLARRLLEDYRSRRDEAALERLSRELLLTEAGLEGAEALGDLKAASGAYRDALDCWRRLLALHPQARRVELRVREKLLRLLRLLGEDREYTHERAVFLERLPGEAARFEAILRQVPMANSAVQSSREPASRWGGEVPEEPRALDVTRGLSLSWDSWGWSREGLGPPARRSYAAFAAEPENAGHFPFFPLVDGDRVFISSVFQLHVLDGKPGGGAITREIRKPLLNQDATGFAEREGEDSALYTVTLWKRAHDPACTLEGLPPEVLVTQYISDRIRPATFMGYDITVEIPIRSLIAYDAASGRELWRTGTLRRPEGAEEDAAARAARALKAARAPARRPQPRVPLDEDDDEGDDERSEDPDDEELAREILRVHGQRFHGFGGLDDLDTSIARDFSYTSPVVVEGGLVVAGGWIQRGYVNSALRALSLDSGQVVWERLISGFQVEPTMFGEMSREPFAGSILARDGVVYYAGHGGTVCAAEISTGKILWATTYDTIPINASWSRQALKRTLSWGTNPLLLLGHVLVVAPRDSELVYGIDTGRGPAGSASGGQVLWKLGNPVLSSYQAELRDVLGSAGGKIYFSGPGDLPNGPPMITAVDLSGTDLLGKFPPGQGPIKLAPVRLDLELPGPGTVTSAGVLVSDRDGLLLCTLDLKEARPVGPRPYRVTEAGPAAGRVIVHEGRVYVISRQMLTSFLPTPRASGAPGPTPATAPRGR